MSDWSSKKSLQAYNIQRWGNGYFDISASGHLRVTGNNAKHNIDLNEVAELAQQSGLSLPLLARFPRIIHQRVDELCQAFDNALHTASVKARYTPVYPIKVNQNRNVVEEILNTASGRAGLEAGSKPELLKQSYAMATKIATTSVLLLPVYAWGYVSTWSLKNCLN
jgi:arginine decarboxylase